MKQVIILRKDLNMRKGKMVAQGAHASVDIIMRSYHDTDVEEWLCKGQKKICVSCNSEQELLDLYEQAKVAGIICSLIKDAGHTEFKEPTYTAVAIGPANDNRIDIITKELRLLW